VKHNAFMPPPDLRLSVYNVSDLPESDIWTLGKKRVSVPQNRTLYGRGELTVAAVAQVKLRVEADNDPPRHADICGWPEEKAERKVLAMQLAQQAKLRWAPTD